MDTHRWTSIRQCLLTCELLEKPEHIKDLHSQGLSLILKSTEVWCKDKSNELRHMIYNASIYRVLSALFQYIQGLKNITN